MAAAAGRDGTARRSNAAGLAVLRAADDGVAALVEGFQLARSDLSRRQEADRREVFEALLAGGLRAVGVLGRAADLGLDLAARTRSWSPVGTSRATLGAAARPGGARAAGTAR